MRIEDFRDTCSGPVALLGGGESVKRLDLDAIAQEMPVVGINESWRGFRTKWRVFIDFELQRFDGYEEYLFFPRRTSFSWRYPDDMVPIRHLPRNFNHDPPFMGFRLNEGTYGYFAGMLALEVVTWCGFDPITLLGFDCDGGYWIDDEKETPGGAKTHAVWERQLIAAITELNRGGMTVFWK